MWNEYEQNENKNDHMADDGRDVFLLVITGPDKGSCHPGKDDDCQDQCCGSEDPYDTV